jgi:hypothetical protein
MLTEMSENESNMQLLCDENQGYFGRRMLGSPGFSYPTVAFPGVIYHTHNQATGISSSRSYTQFKPTAVRIPQSGESKASQRQTIKSAEEHLRTFPAFPHLLVAKSYESTS